MNTVKKLTLTLAATALTAALVMPSVNAATGTITVDTLRVRTAPSTSSEVLRSLTSGDQVEVIEDNGEWYKIKLSDGNEAYVYSEYVKLEEDLTTNEENKEGQNVVNEEITLAQNTRIYILPVLFSNEIGKTTESVTVKVIEKMNNWVCIDYNGVQGWVLVKGSTVRATETSTTPVEDTTVEEPVATETKTGYVNVSSAYVRSESSKSGDIVTSLTLNSEVTILNEDNGWYEIQLSDGTGYIYAELVSDSKTVVTSRSSVSRTANVDTAVEDNTEQEVIATGYVSASAVNVRSGASTSSSVVTTLRKKAEVNILEDLEDWYKVTTSKGVGYVSKQYVVDSLDDIPETQTTTYTASATGSASSTAQELVEYAKQFLGCSYSYAGSGPSSFDCSGFTMYVFAHFGVSLPHNARTQSYYGEYVSRDNLEPGDLLIFRDRANSSIGHAGIYIGGGYFIHAENSKTDVTTTSIYSNYYSTRFVEGRRLV